MSLVVVQVILISIISNDRKKKTLKSAISLSITLDILVIRIFLERIKICLLLSCLVLGSVIFHYWYVGKLRAGALQIRPKLSSAVYNREVLILGNKNAEKPNKAKLRGGPSSFPYSFRCVPKPGH